MAISQRVDLAGPHAERRDALDQRWAALLEVLGMVPVLIPNALQDPRHWARALGINALLLSGGNDVTGRVALAGQQAPERDQTETALLAMASAHAWPVLGVCRGLQMLNRHLGGQLSEVAGHVAVRHRVRRCALLAGPLACLPDELEVNSFHQFGLSITALAPALEAVMCDAQGHVEAAQHRQLPWAGIMWHPEREPTLTDADRSLLTALFNRP